MRGRALKLSAPRRLVNDLMRFSVTIPRITVQRRMKLGPLLKARAGLARQAILDCHLSEGICASL